MIHDAVSRGGPTSVRGDEPSAARRGDEIRPDEIRPDDGRSAVGRLADEPRPCACHGGDDGDDPRVCTGSSGADRRGPSGGGDGRDPRSAGSGAPVGDGRDRSFSTSGGIDEGDDRVRSPSGGDARAGSAGGTELRPSTESGFAVVGTSSWGGGDKGGERRPPVSRASDGGVGEIRWLGFAFWVGAERTCSSSASVISLRGRSPGELARRAPASLGSGVLRVGTTSDGGVGESRCGGGDDGELP